MSTMRKYTETNSYIETFMGHKMNVFEPSSEDISIIDIAWSLGMKCRYSGHCNRYYSVAEHSIHVADLVPEEYKLQALLHDMTEAYLTDMPTPIKVLLPDYKRVEKNLERFMNRHFGLPDEHDIIVKEADFQALRAEAAVMISSGGEEWAVNREDNSPLVNIDFQFYGPKFAWRMFLDMYEDLNNRRITK